MSLNVGDVESVIKLIDSFTPVLRTITENLKGFEGQVKQANTEMSASNKAYVGQILSEQSAMNSQVKEVHRRMVQQKKADDADYTNWWKSSLKEQEQAAREVAAATSRATREAAQEAARYAREVETVAKQSTARLQELALTWRTVGRDAAQVGSALSMFVTAPIIAGGAAIAKFSSDFESNMVKLVTLSDVTEANMVKMRAAILELAPAVGIGPVKLSEALLQVTSTGIRGMEAMDILRDAAKLSAIGMGDTTTVAKTLTSALQAYEKQGLTSAEASNILYKTVVEGKGELQNFAGAMGRVVGLSSMVGVSLAEVGAYVATFTRVGVSAEEAVTALRQTLLRLTVKEAPNTDKELRNIGSSFDDLRRKIATDGLMASLTWMLDNFKDQSDALGKLFPNIRALTGVMSVAGAQGKDYAAVFGHINAAINEYDPAFKRAAETMKFKWDQLTASIQVMAIAIGDHLKPIINDIIKYFQDGESTLNRWVKWFGSLDESTKNAIFTIIGLTAALGPLLFLFGQTARGIGLVYDAILLVRKLNLGGMLSELVFWSKNLITAIGTGSGMGIVGALASGVPTILIFATALAGIAVAAQFAMAMMDLMDQKEQARRDKATQEAADANARAMATNILRDEGKLGKNGAALNTWETGYAYRVLGQHARELRERVAGTVVGSGVPPPPPNLGGGDGGGKIEGLDAAQKGLEKLIREMATFKSHGADVTTVFNRMHSEVENLDEVWGKLGMDVPVAGKVLMATIKSMGDQVEGMDVASKAVGRATDKINKEVESNYKLMESALGEFDKAEDTTLEGSVVRIQNYYANKRSQINKDHLFAQEALDAIDQAEVAKINASLLRWEKDAQVKGDARQALQHRLDEIASSGIEAEVQKLERARDRELREQDRKRDADVAYWDEMRRLTNEYYDTLERRASAMTVPYALSAVGDQLSKINDGYGKIAKSMGGVVAAFVSGSSSTEESTGKIVAAVGAMFESMVQADSGMAALSRSSQAFGSTLQSTGSWYAAAAAGVLEMIGEVITTLSAHAKQVKDAEIAYNKLAASIVDTYGSMVRANEVGKIWGLTIAETAVYVQANVEENWKLQAQLETLADRIKTTTDTLAKYKLTWTDTSGSMLQFLHSGVVKDIITDMDTLSQAGVSQDKIVSAMAETLNQYVISAMKAGTGVNESLKPTIRTLIQMNQLSEDAARALLGIAPADEIPKWQELSAVMEKYGMTLADMGKGGYASNVADVAATLSNEWKLLSMGNADMGKALQGMIDKGGLLDLVKNVQKFGLTLPEEMKPVLQALAESGKLVDINGNVLKDLSTFKFEGSYAKKTDELIAALDRLTGVIDPGAWVTDPGDKQHPTPGGARPSALDGSSLLLEGSYGSADRVPAGAQRFEVTVTAPINVDGREMARGQAQLVMEYMAGQLIVSGV